MLNKFREKIRYKKFLMKKKTEEQFKAKQKAVAKFRKELIKNATKSELAFKKKLDDAGIKYIFQKGFIQGYLTCIVDFYIPSPYKICIEVDGGYHNTKAQKKKDDNRDEYLRKRGFNVIRIKNEDVKDFDIRTIL